MTTTMTTTNNYNYNNYNYNYNYNYYYNSNSHPLSASTHKSVRTGGHNARKQSSSSKMQESRFSSINAQSARERLNPQATSAPGHVIVAQGSATPESGCTLTNSRTDDNIDNRSVDFDSVLHDYEHEV